MKARHNEPLRALSDAVSAAFDAEMAAYREAAVAFCVALQDETPRNKYSVCGEETPSLDEEQEHEVGTRDGSAALDSKWAELEEILSSVRPAEQASLPSHRSVRQLKSEFHKMRMVSRQRLFAMSRPNDVVESSITDLCREVLVAWAGRVRAIVSSKTEMEAAEVHWRWKSTRKVLFAWRGFYYKRHDLRERSQRVAVSARTFELRRRIQKWQMLGRWSQGRQKLKVLIDFHRLHHGMMSWRGRVEIARQIKGVHRRNLSRLMFSSIQTWKSYVQSRLAKRERQQVSRAFMLGRKFRLFVRGVAIARRHQHTMEILSCKRTTRVRRLAFEAWNGFKDRKRRKNMAIGWWSHCLLSACFEAWNLLHRCFVYHKEINLRATSHNSNRLVSKKFVIWRAYVNHCRERREAVTKLITKILIRPCLRRLLAAVHADRDRSRKLWSWKIHRCILNWRRRTHRQAMIRCKIQALQALHRHWVLNRFVWSAWRVAFVSKLNGKRLDRIADQNVMREWWERWKDHDAYMKAIRAMLHVVEVEWRWRQQRNAVSVWRHYSTMRSRAKAKLASGIRHRRCALLRVCFRRWRVWGEWLRFSCRREREADNHSRRVIMLRWHRRTRLQQEEDQTRAFCIVYRRPAWLQRSYLVKWHFMVRAKVRGRQARLFQLWWLLVNNARRDRKVHALRERIMLRFVWRRWSTYKCRQDRIRDATHVLVAQTVSQLLRKCLLGVWRHKAANYSRARRKLLSVVVLVTKLMCFRRWFRRVVRSKLARTAKYHHKCVVRRRYLRRLYQKAILWPRELVSKWRLQTQSLRFSRWKVYHQGKRLQRNTVQHMIEWRQKQALTAINERVSVRQARRLLKDRAHQFRRSHSLQCHFDAWLSFTVSMLNCKMALARIRELHLQRTLTRWRRAFVRQCYVRNVEAQYDSALLRKSWIQFNDAIKRQQQARGNWLGKLRLVGARHVLFRWKMMVEMKRNRELTGEWLNVKTQRRLLRVVFEEWTHFLTIRSFVKNRQGRELHTILLLTLCHWKIYAIVEYRRRETVRRLICECLVRWKQLAFVLQAGREIKARRDLATLVTVWKAWRLEFWVRHSLVWHKTGQLRRCFNVWRITVAERGLVDQPSAQPRKSIRRSAFDEALIFQHTARRQRILVQQVMHAWSLGVQTSKRQREKDLLLPQRPLRLNIHAAKETRSATSSAREEENTDPNRLRPAIHQTCDTRPDLALYRGGQAEALALVFWSTKLARDAFHQWRLSSGEPYRAVNSASVRTYASLRNRKSPDAQNRLARSLA